MTEVSAEAIRAAIEGVPAAFRGMPQFVSEPLSETLGRPVVVKAESANPIGCFKGRGTWLVVKALVAAGEVGEGSGLVAASAGNFGQGVAYAARAHRIPFVVFAAETANAAKVAAMRRLGAEVRLAGEDFDAAREAAAHHAATSGWRLIIDGQDPHIAIGAGTMAVELTDAVERGDLPPLEALYVPVGNGALIAGVGTWLKAAAPATRVIGVQAAGRTGHDVLLAGGPCHRDANRGDDRRRHRRARPGAGGAGDHAALRRRHGPGRRRRHPCCPARAGGGAAVPCRAVGCGGLGGHAKRPRRGGGDRLHSDRWQPATVAGLRRSDSPSPARWLERFPARQRKRPAAAAASERWRRGAHGWTRLVRAGAHAA